MSLETAVLGETITRIDLSTSEEHRLAARRMAEQAQRSLLIHTRNLDPAIYDAQDFIDAVGKLARSSRRAEVRILVQDSGPVVQRGHRLIQLAYQLTSFIKIRRPDEMFKDFNQAFLLADDRGYIHRPHGDRFEGTACFNDPARVAELRQYFDRVWEHSQPDPNIRRLDI